jgi:hypothetical protein
MHAAIASRIHQLNASKQLLEASIAAAPCDPHVPPAGEWSIAQVVEHLLASETGTLGYMKKKSSGGWDALEDASDTHHASSAAINARLESNERYKAPDVLPEPTNTIALGELFEKWNALRAELLDFVSHIPPEHFHKLVFRQPAAGMLTVLHALDFMDAHLRHHLPQIERINSAAIA